MLIQGRTPIRRTFRLNQPPKNNNFLPSLFSPSNPTRTTGSNSHSCGLLLPLQSAAIGALHLCNPTQQQQFPRDAAALSHSPSSRAAAKRSTNQMQLPTIEQSATTLLLPWFSTSSARCSHLFFHLGSTELSPLPQLASSTPARSCAAACTGTTASSTAGPTPTAPCSTRLRACPRALLCATPAT
jgi:hypothetical protein